MGGKKRRKKKKSFLKLSEVGLQAQSSVKSGEIDERFVGLLGDLAFPLVSPKAHLTFIHPFFIQHLFLVCKAVLLQPHGAINDGCSLLVLLKKTKTHGGTLGMWRYLMFYISKQQSNSQKLFLSGV